MKHETRDFTRTVWIVEDSEGFAGSLTELINSTDDMHCERTFNKCEDALELIGQGSLPDIILMDIGLPGMNGIEGIKRVKVLAPAVQVIVLTVFEDNENIFHAICAGASGYLHKSATLEAIIDSLKAILLGGAPVNPQIAKKVLAMFAQNHATKSDYGLSSREKEVLQHLLEGLSKRQIGDKLFVSHNTIDTHLRNIYAKLQVNSRVSAVTKALKENIV
jgi:DNA-binding NarL/FixJ family response regulator